VSTATRCTARWHSRLLLHLRLSPVPVLRPCCLRVPAHLNIWTMGLLSIFPESLAFVETWLTRAFVCCSRPPIQYTANWHLSSCSSASSASVPGRRCSSTTSSSTSSAPVYTRSPSSVGGREGRHAHAPRVLQNGLLVAVVALVSLAVQTTARKVQAQRMRMHRMHAIDI
jgi:hypothetical protein